MHLREPRFQLIDALIDGAQSHACSHRGCLGCIEPEALILLQDSKLRHHIVLTALAFQHGHAQHVHLPPSGFQTAPVMAIASELVSIAAKFVSYHN